MDVLHQIRQLLQRPLPGIEAHREFVPTIPDAVTRLQAPPNTARKSAVVVPLLVSAQNDIEVVFTVRSEHLSSHKGQISFPGGRLEDGEDAITGGLRELQEEIGTDTSTVEFIGTLSPLFIPPSNSAVEPIVCVIGNTGGFAVNEAEVSEVLRVPLRFFLDPTNLVRAPMPLYGKNVLVPQWHIHPTTPLWGATAMILNEFVWITRTAIQMERVVD